MIAIVQALIWLGRLLFMQFPRYTAFFLMICLVWWDAILLVLDKFVAWVIGPVVVWILNAMIDLFAFFINLLLRLLPLAPDSPIGSLDGLVSNFGWVNRYVPISESIYFLAFCGTVYGSVFIYKLVKFIRGGG